MMDLYFWPTPNGYKVALFVEETKIPCPIKPLRLPDGAQHKPDYLKINPNGKMPGLVDHETGVSVFESGAILLYLADKFGKFLSTDKRRRNETISWLFWQTGGFGPMLGQNHHFRSVAPQKNQYAIERFTTEAERLFGVLDKQLWGREFLVEEYSIADLMIYPWALGYEMQGINIDRFPNVKSWIERIKKRPATAATYAMGEKLKNG